MLVVYSVTKLQHAEQGGASTVARQVLECNEPIPPGAVWIDMIEPTQREDQQVEDYLQCKIPTRDDPHFTEPLEAYYAENGVRYLQASVVGKTGVIFVICGPTLVTVRYGASESFEILGQKLCNSWGHTLEPDAIALGLVHTLVNRSARALGKVGKTLDEIAAAGPRR